MNKTGIEYLTHSWNPLAMRCTKVSESCAHCWHLTMCDRMTQNPKLPRYQREIYAGIGKPELVKSRLDAPLKRKKPAIIGVQFMGDLGHKDITISDFYKVVVAMEEAKQHVFMVLTKRIETFLERMNNPKWWQDNGHIWIGVTAENQARYDERWPILAQIPAKVRFLSLEPLLGNINPHLGGAQIQPDLIIAGCESGPGRRPAKVEWFEDLSRQCRSTLTPYFLKQMEVELGNGRVGVEKMPFLCGRVWDQLPGRPPKGDRRWQDTMILIMMEMVRNI